MKPKFLGKKNTTFKSPSENILDAINRELSKEMFGEDIWNAYEFHFLSKNYQPILLPLEIRIPASSEKTVESKGIDIMIALDISRSMMAEDIVNNYTRLDLSQR